MNNKNESIRSLMKQKLASKPQDTLSGKEKLKLLKQMKEESHKPPKQGEQQGSTKKEVSLQSDGNNHIQSIPTKIASQPVQLPSDFFDNAPSAVFSKEPNEIHTNSTSNNNHTSDKAPHAPSSFPTGFFDNPYEEKLVLESISSNVAPTSEVLSEAVEKGNAKTLDGDFEGFMQEIKTISQKIEDQLAPSEEKEQVIEDEEEENPLLVNEEFVEKLRQTTYYTKLGLFYQKLEQATASTASSSTTVPSSNDSAINIAQVEKEVQELELLLVQQEGLAPSLQTSNPSHDSSEAMNGAGTNIIDQVYLEKVEKKRKHQQLIDAIEEEEKQEEERRKRARENESSTSNGKEDEKDDDENDDDNDEEEEEEEEEDHRFVYNPLDFISYPN